MTEVIFDLSRETIIKKTSDGSINDYLMQIEQRKEWVNKITAPAAPKANNTTAPKVSADKTANASSAADSKQSESIVSKIFKKLFK